MKNVARLLSTALVISSVEFAKLTPSKQTEALALNTTKVPVIFVPTFLSLRDKHKLVQRLLAGEDVSVELEFNEIELSPEEMTTIKAVQPVLAKIADLKEVYRWLPEELYAFEVNSENVYGPGGYQVTRAKALSIWKYASKFWATGQKSSPSPRVSRGYNNHTVSVTNDTVKIGCQRVSRGQVEALARNFGWEPVVE